ncbi:uncharacterized protein LOC121419238 isoform X1 [Lytechinus variegatus]|uniref:uncharacterized protein LOC121419238 isoform X1 n=1 Tax=Lytechinus variegatus TaxID=7654 RepID=UPI001BB1EA3A|nr:uncharacterized protein LOC121419238 isoform X1 [Lytechinus variegatus]
MVMAITKLFRLLRFEFWLSITMSMLVSSLAATSNPMSSSDLDTTMSPSQSTVINDFESMSSTPITTFQTDTNQSQSLQPSHGISNDDKIPIYLGGFFTLGGNWDGSGILPVVEMALEHINNRPDLLADYDLRMVWNDTQCDAGLGTKILFDQIFRKPQKLMILGPACSTATQAVAGTAHYWNLVTMSYASASSILSNRNKFPLFYRTYMPDAMYNPARVRLIKEYGWTRVATIHENHELFSLAIDNLLTLLRQANITIITSESFSENPRNQVENLKNQDAKIILANMYENMARRVFCEAYKQGLTGEGYVWFLIGWYSDGWYQVQDSDVTCTISQMKEAVEGSYYIATESLQLSPSKVPGITGLTAETYIKETLQRLDSPRYVNLNYTFNNLAPFGYDATWAVALMLNRSVEVMKNMTFSDGIPRRLENFTYEDEEMARLFFNLLNETEFTGITGPVSFKSGDRVGITQIEQLQLGCKSNQIQIGSTCLTLNTDKKTWSLASSTCSLGGDRTLFTPSLDAVEDLFDVVSEEGVTTTKWYIGLYVDADGQFSDVSGSLNQSELEAFTESLSPWSSSSSSGCVVIDINPSEENNNIVIVDCDETYPFICSESTKFLEQRLGLYDTAGDVLEWNSRALVWPGTGEPPLDRTPEVNIVIVNVYEGIDTYLYIIMCILASIGILFAVLFLVFNVKYRNQKFVKLSSPNLNNLIILGSVMVYSWIFLYGLDGNLVGSQTHQAVCQLRNWVLSIGFVIAFGAMFSKTWRVHRVATFKIMPRKRAIRDTQLYLIILFLVAVDFVILLVWQIVDPMVLQIRNLFLMNDPDDEFVMLQPYVKYCHSTYQTYWLVVMYIYKGILLLFGTFLAWETRKVKIPALNDSKLIGISVYNVFILCAIGVGVSYALRTEPAALFIFLSFVVLFCTTITLGVVFVPKIISVYKDPLGENATGKKNRTSGLETIDMRSSTCIDNAPEPSIVSSTGPYKDTQKLQEKVDMLEKQLQGTKDLNAILKDTDDNMCGLWCCGLSCGCSYRHGCFYSDEDDDSLPKYTIKQEESSSGVFTGNPKPRGQTKPTMSADDQAQVAVESNAVDVEVGIENGGYVSTSKDANDKETPPSPVLGSKDLSKTVSDGAEASPNNMSTWQSSSDLFGLPCGEGSEEASNVRVIAEDDTPCSDGEDEC